MLILQLREPRISITSKDTIIRTKTKLMRQKGTWILQQERTFNSKKCAIDFSKSSSDVIKKNGYSSWQEFMKSWTILFLTIKSTALLHNSWLNKGSSLKPCSNNSPPLRSKMSCAEFTKLVTTPSRNRIWASTSFPTPPSHSIRFLKTRYLANMAGITKTEGRPRSYNSLTVQS